MAEDLIAGRYVIEGELGRGASATVFRARDSVLQRTVALKVIAAALATDDDLRWRFEQEALLSARLNHPNIVTVHDVGALPDGRAFIAMRLLEGKSLDRLLADRGRLTTAEVVGIVRHVAAALDYTHAAGLVHRDVKPSNVNVDPSGWATLTDFGIARALDTAHATLPGLTIGTPRYMSPEQVRGEETTPATDIYSLGVMAYEMLTGRPPFEGEGTALMYKIVHEEPPAPRQFNPGLPPDAVAAVQRALAKDPAGRWPSAGAFAEALETALAAAADATAIFPASDAPTLVSPAPTAPAAPAAATIIPPAALPAAATVIPSAAPDAPPAAVTAAITGAAASGEAAPVPLQPLATAIPPTAPEGAPPPRGRSRRGLVIAGFGAVALVGAAAAAFFLFAGGDDDNARKADDDDSRGSLSATVSSAGGRRGTQAAGTATALAATPSAPGTTRSLASVIARTATPAAPQPTPTSQAPNTSIPATAVAIPPTSVPPTPIPPTPVPVTEPLYIVDYAACHTEGCASGDQSLTAGQPIWVGFELSRETSELVEMEVYFNGAFQFTSTFTGTGTEYIELLPAADGPGLLSLDIYVGGEYLDSLYAFVL